MCLCVCLIGQTVDDDSSSEILLPGCACSWVCMFKYVYMWVHVYTVSMHVLALCVHTSHMCMYPHVSVFLVRACIRVCLLVHVCSYVLPCVSLCVCPCVFMYIHMCAYTYPCVTCFHVSRWVYLSVPVCVHACICPCVYPACLCLNVSIHVWVCLYIYLMHVLTTCIHMPHVSACIQVFVFLCSCVSMLVSICPCMCTEVTLPVRCDCPVSFWSIHASLWGTGHGVVDSHLLLPRQP